MNYILFSLYDEKAKAYGTPFTQPNEACGRRQFSDAVNSDTTVGKNPHDYTLFQVAEFDWSKGELIPNRKMLCNGAELVKPE